MHLRFLTHEDSDALLEWRNDPVTRAMSRNSDLVTAQQHQKWFATALADPKRMMVMGVIDQRQIGLLRFDPVGSDWEVGINLNPSERGKGLGTLLLRLGCDQFWTQHPDQKLIAAVRTDNVASRKIFEACGFHHVNRQDQHDHFEAVRP